MFSDTQGVVYSQDFVGFLFFKLILKKIRL